MDDAKLLEMFDLFQCQLVTNEFPADHYVNVISKREKCTKISQFAFMFLGFCGGVMASYKADNENHADTLKSHIQGEIEKSIRGEMTKYRRTKNQIQSKIENIDNEWILVQVLQFIDNIQK